MAGTTRRSFGRIEKRTSGRYRAAYVGPDGRLYRAPLTFDAKDDATAWLSARRAEIEMDVWAPHAVGGAAAKKSIPTFEPYAEHWLTNRKTQGRELKPRTKEHYQSLLEQHTNPTFGEMRLDSIRAEDVNDWCDVVAPGKDTTRAHAYSLLRTILGTAASARPRPLIPYNPAQIRGGGGTKPVHKVRPTSLAELETIVENLPARYRLMALLAAWCAMRFGELAELRRGDLDLKTNRVRIRRAVVRIGGKPTIGPPKSDAGVRDVAIPPHLLPVIKHHLKVHTATGKDALLFPAAGGDHMAPSTLYKVYYPARTKAGRDDLR